MIARAGACNGWAMTLLVSAPWWLVGGCHQSYGLVALDQLIRDGVVADRAELARLGHVTRARLTQIMNLLYLAPDLQEKLLFWPTFERGRNPITEKQVRPIAAVRDWGKQRRMWEGRKNGTENIDLD